MRPMTKRLGLLPLDKVKKARGRELDKKAEHKVKKDITYEEARKRGFKIVKSSGSTGGKPDQMTRKASVHGAWLRK